MKLIIKVRKGNKPKEIYRRFAKYFVYTFYIGMFDLTVIRLPEKNRGPK